MVDSFIRPPEGYQSAFSSKVGSRFSAMSNNSAYRSASGIDDHGSKEPYQLIIDKNLRSMRKRAQDNTREELTSVLQRVENVMDFVNLKFFSKKIKIQFKIYFVQTLVEYEKSVFTTDNIKPPQAINEGDTSVSDDDEDEVVNLK